MKMKTTIKKMNTVNLNELIAIAKPMLQTLGVGAATIVLRKIRSSVKNDLSTGFRSN